MSLFSPPTDRLHVITPTGAPVSPMGTDNLAAYRDTHDTLIHSERLLNLLHTHTRTHACTPGSPLLSSHTLTNRCCPGIGGLSCVFILERRLLDSEAGLDGRKETEGRD